MTATDWTSLLSRSEEGKREAPDSIRLVNARPLERSRQQKHRDREQERKQHHREALSDMKELMNKNAAIVHHVGKISNNVAFSTSYLDPLLGSFHCASSGRNKNRAVIHPGRVRSDQTRKHIQTHGYILQQNRLLPQLPAKPRCDAHKLLPEWLCNVQVGLHNGHLLLHQGSIGRNPTSGCVNTGCSACNFRKHPGIRHYKSAMYVVCEDGVVEGRGHKQRNLVRSKRVRTVRCEATTSENIVVRQTPPFSNQNEQQSYCKEKERYFSMCHVSNREKKEEAERARSS